MAQKMSKSCGNVITPDDVVYGVVNLDPSFEFRFADGMIIEYYKSLGVWRNRLGDSMYYTSTRNGKIPVFLHQKDNPLPADLLIEGQKVKQHADKLDLWWIIVGFASRFGIHTSSVLCLVVFSWWHV